MEDLVKRALEPANLGGHQAPMHGNNPWDRWKGKRRTALQQVIDKHTTVYRKPKGPVKHSGILWAHMSGKKSHGVGRLEPKHQRRRSALLRMRGYFRGIKVKNRPYFGHNDYWLRVMQAAQREGNMTAYEEARARAFIPEREKLYNLINITANATKGMKREARRIIAQQRILRREARLNATERNATWVAEQEAKKKEKEKWNEVLRRAAKWDTNAGPIPSESDFECWLLREKDKVDERFFWHHQLGIHQRGRRKKGGVYHG
mmetsp:Transcript_9519/g.18634  ORF Transcript_9519/g.18634 Transcript_9519/m.18634 type:complete len:261 (+) Transcript_9519:211-993(+)